MSRELGKTGRSSRPIDADNIVKGDYLRITATKIPGIWDVRKSPSGVIPTHIAAENLRGDSFRVNNNDLVFNN